MEDSPVIEGYSLKQHSRDMLVIDQWMKGIDDDPLRITKAEASSAELVQFLEHKAKQFTIFHDELARQAATHSPKLAQ